MGHSNIWVLVIKACRVWLQLDNFRCENTFLFRVRPLERGLPNRVDSLQNYIRIVPGVKERFAGYKRTDTIYSMLRVWPRYLNMIEPVIH